MLECEYATDTSDEEFESSHPSKKLKVGSTKGAPQWISKSSNASRNPTNRLIEISDSEDSSSRISISECSDSDFEARVRKRKRGSEIKKEVFGSEKRKILQNHRLGTGGTKARSAETTSTFQQARSTAKAPIQQERSAGKPSTSTFQQANSAGKPSTSIFKQARSAGEPSTSIFQQARSAGKPSTSTLQQARSAGKPSTSTFQQPRSASIFQPKENEKKKFLSQLQPLSSSEDEDDVEIVLDLNTVSGKKIVIHKQVAKHLKPHQVDGIKHMYQCCYGSIDKIGRNPKGSGCILAHCMGLGKTLQLITLLHTVINYPEFQTNRILILCPKSTLSNWKAEIKKWIGKINNSRKLNIFEFTDLRQNSKQLHQLENYSRYTVKNNNAACFIMGYESFRSLVFYGGEKKKLATNDERIRNMVKQHLLDATDLIVCDEGHTIKSLKSLTNRAVTKIKTKRRIVLTGTPVQNNLMEYYAMVSFVKPSLLGTAHDFRSEYAIPIEKGQHKDSSRAEIKAMRVRSFNLNRELNSVVHRREVSTLLKDLPDKYEYVLYIPMSESQTVLYEHYLKENPFQINSKRLFPDYAIMRKIWTHLKYLEFAYENAVKKNAKMEGQAKVKNVSRNEYEADDESDTNDEPTDDTSIMRNWWQPFVAEEDMNNISQSPKFQIMFEILKQCQLNQEKCLIFSTATVCLDVVEFFLARNNSWKKDVDYYRLDGSTKTLKRHEMIVQFNKPENQKVKLFLISAKAGGQGINLTGANRIILMDTDWNPSVDQQSIFRIFRFGQLKNCYIYRLLSMGTMEEKIYSRSVTKQAMSFRVLDKLPVDRNYSTAELEELYTLTKPDWSVRATPIVPKDELLTNLLIKFPEKVYKYHEHKTLLDNKSEEDITEEEKQEALELYNSNKMKNEQMKLANKLRNEQMNLANKLINEQMNLAENGIQNSVYSGADPSVPSTSKAALESAQVDYSSDEIRRPEVPSTSKAALQSAQVDYSSYEIRRPEVSQQPYAPYAAPGTPNNFLGKPKDQIPSTMRSYLGRYMELEE